MNWSKGLIVKEKILLHLLGYQQYLDEEAVPVQTTQQGIADIISAPRPHVSMALKELREKDQITERTCHIIQGKRRQKVYFLTIPGQNIANQIKTRVLTSQVNVIDAFGKQDFVVDQVRAKYNLSIFEIINQCTQDGTLDLVKPLEKDSKGYAPKPIPKPQQQLQPTSQPTPQPQTKPQTKCQPHVTPVQSPAESEPIKDANVQRTPYQVTRTQPPEPYYSHPHNQNYPEDYPPYYYPTEPIFSFSEKTSAIIFSVGYLLMILGVIACLYLITTEKIFIIVPLILLLTFGVSIMSISISILWENPTWQKNILNLLAITVPIILYVLFFAMIEPTLSYYELGLWLIIIISFLGLANSGTFIPIFNRAQVLGALGVIILIDAPVALVYYTLGIYQTGFWLLAGVICLYVGYYILTKYQFEVELEFKIIEKLAPGIAFGLGLGILSICGLSVLVIDFQNIADYNFLPYVILTVWGIIGLGLILQTFRKKGYLAFDTISTLYLALPMFFGVILIFFGFFLFNFEKMLETVIELFLGGILIIYGIKRLRAQKYYNLFLTGLIIVAFALTLTYLIFYRFA